ncbi:hypothetical protein [Mesorhizobium australafricanum]|uniref:Transposase n=1 Tax=Mesorhizobium australafricanum TaxID=3072311 RepID=A0ABU4X1P1_9HYPH|nr:hypothetical protein [Mesorhizobium sp. VK3E]MDX8441398.1 hypothetical protein [Mesorhizobium sp. VK3E]
MERPLAIANAEFRYRLRDRNGTKLKPRDAKRAMMTSLAIADAVMMSVCSSLAGIHVEWSVARLFWRRAARDACPKPDNGVKHVGFNTTGHLRDTVVSSEIAPYCMLSTLAQPLQVEIRQHWMRQDWVNARCAQAREMSDARFP